MQISLPVYLTCLGGMVVLTASIAIRAFLHWEKPGARTLGFLMLAMAVWAGFYMLEIMHPSLAVKTTARKILYLGMQMSPALWLGFALRYTGVSAWWSQRGRVFILAVPGMLAFSMGVTNEHHRLIWNSLTAPLNHPGALILEFGLAFWIFAAIAYGLIGVSLAVYLFTFLKSERNFRIKTGVLLAGALVTSIVNGFFLLGKNPAMLDPTPLSFALSAPLVAFGFFRFGLNSLLPLASVLVMDALRDAVIILNDKDHVTDTNLAAKELLGIETIPEKTSVFNLLPQADLFREIWQDPDARLKLGLIKDRETSWYEARVIPLYKSDRDLLGRVIVLHNTTAEQSLLRAELRRSAQLGILEEIGRQIADSFDKREILQRSIDAVVNRFGYAEAAISLLNDDDILELIAIGGTQDFGYRPGFKQKVGDGIIGHTAATRKTYVSNNVADDPYYFSNEPHQGSAMCVPILNDWDLLGVLYVESAKPGDFDKEDAKTLETLATQISASLQRASLYSRTQEHLRIMSTVQTISQVISSSLDLETILNSVVKILKETFGYTHIGIYLLEDDHLHLGAQIGYSTDRMVPKIHIDHGVSGRAVRTKTVQFIRDATKDAEFIQADDAVTSEICVPLIKENTALGTLNVEADSSRPLTQEDANLLAILATPIALAVDNARLHAQVKKLATTDAVTGLSNRHVFEQNLITEVERAQRLETSVSLIIFDIDSFKEYNDLWGHPAGDARLKAVAELTQKNLRKYDIAARYGGDEFAVILSNTNQQNALLFARRLYETARNGALQPPIEGLGVPGYTLSIGIATYPQDANTPEQLLIVADNAALRAKHLGKNRIQLAGNLDESN